MLPEQFLERMKRMLGDEYPAFLQSFEEEPYRALRVNTGKVSVEEFLKKSPFSLHPVPWTENGFYYEQDAGPGKHPFHEAGAYYIQEPSAMAPVSFLDARPGERILDLCAAPGGKTTQIADAMGGEGILISNEIHPARAAILSENVERMGIRGCIVTNETPERLTTVFPSWFDKILVDAPCSGEGMFRKNPEACQEWSLENVKLCATRQDQVLNQAAAMLRSGGRLVYSTCTFAPEEDEGTVSRFLQTHPEFEIVEVEAPAGFEGGRPDWTCQPAEGLEKTLRLMPHKVRGEGHYVAVLQKAGASMQDRENRIRKNKKQADKNSPQKEYREFFEFAKEFLQVQQWEGTWVRFGDHLYLGPEDMPSLQGLKVLRPGLHLGILKKGRFEPSHAFALALRPEEAKSYLDLQPQGDAVGRYLSGQTLIMDDSEVLAKGWCLICVGSLSLGWGKLTGDVMKNHYPKGLRKG
ncbi:MAG: NOL1/NOP2/sun family putative RNA methylase [Lachnospiraceae bacterium]|nr:NOL1/NOP2/sun family putative RNA methylase [Lachnospiraceae bacterium]